MKKIILGSNSPRRRELLAGLGYDFEIRTVNNIDESYPAGLTMEEIPQHISQVKAAAYDVGDNEILLTADTVVVLGNKLFGKPHDEAEAVGMLRALSGMSHRVITGVSLTTRESQRTFAVTTEVTFKKLSDAEIFHYVDHYRPYDKAGAYGIQEWIGFVGVIGICGSYFNVMGLPVQRIYQELQTIK